MKPDWADVPAWAKWISKDGNGVWWAYQCKPKRMKGFHFWGNYSKTGNGAPLTAFNPADGYDWKDSLERRP